MALQASTIQAAQAGQTPEQIASIAQTDTIPAKAPTAPTATPPVSVIGTSSAASTLQNTMIPAMTQAKTDLATQNAKLAYNSGQGGTFADGSGFDGNGNPIQAPNTQNSAPSTVNNGTPSNSSNNTQTPTQSPETTPGTPEYQLLNTPEAGNQYVYDPQGNRLEVPIGNIPAGMTTTPPPAPPSISGQVTQSNGTTIKQLSDGTFGSYDASGNYQGTATAQQFQDAQTANTLSQNIANLANGTYPLSATEQAQVNALQASFATLITQQQTANANYTGGVTSAENLYGMGTSISGLGEIKGSIDAGLAKIADLNSQMASAVSSMEEGFKKDDMEMFKDAYDTLTGAQKDRQTAIDKIKADTDAAAKDARDYNEKVQVDQANEAHQQFQDTMSSAQLTEQQKTDAFNEYMQQANLTEKDKQDAVDNYYKGVTASNEKKSLDIQQENADTERDKIDPTKNGDQAEINNAQVTTINGNKYVDGTGLSATAKAQASANGEIVLDGNKLATMTSLTNIQQQFGTFLSAMQGAGVLDKNFKFTIIPSTAGTGNTNSGGTNGAFTYHTAGDATPALKDFNTSIFGTDDGSKVTSGSLLSDLSKLPDSGALIATIKDNALKDGDDAKTMQNKISAITNILVNSENSLLSSQIPTGNKIITYGGKNYSVDASGNMTAQ